MYCYYIINKENYVKKGRRVEMKKDQKLYRMSLCVMMICIMFTIFTCIVREKARGNYNSVLSEMYDGIGSVPDNASGVYVMGVSDIKNYDTKIVIGVLGSILSGVVVWGTKPEKERIEKKENRERYLKKIKINKKVVFAIGIGVVVVGAGKYIKDMRAEKEMARSMEKMMGETEAQPGDFGYIDDEEEAEKNREKLMDVFNTGGNVMGARTYCKYDEKTNELELVHSVLEDDGYEEEYIIDRVATAVSGLVKRLQNEEVQTMPLEKVIVVYENGEGDVFRFEYDEEVVEVMKSDEKLKNIDLGFGALMNYELATKIEILDMETCEKYETFIKGEMERRKDFAEKELKNAEEWWNEGVGKIEVVN